MENASKALIIAGAILISILLITIGIVLINSGRNITTQGTSQIASQEIQAFNSQFTPYEGVITGSQVRSLLAVARASNATDKAHPVLVYSSDPGAVNETSINNTKKYNVQICYSTGEQDFIAGGIIVGGTPSGHAYIKSEEGYIDIILIDVIND